MLLLLNEKTLAKQVKDGAADIEELVQYLIKNYNVYDLAKALAEAQVESLDAAPITLSQEDYNRLIGLFKVRGIKPDGSVETRGRKSK